MNDKKLIIKNYAYFLIGALLLTGFQVTLWPFLFGHFPAPQLWIPILTFWSVYRHFNESLIMSYLLTLVIAPLTAMPLGLLLLILLSISCILFLIKIHFYQPGVIYFIFSSLLASGLLPILHAVYSWSFEPTPIQSILFFDRLLQILLTTLIAFPLYSLFSRWDHFTSKKLPTETGGVFE